MNVRKPKAALVATLGAMCLLAASSCDFGQPITTSPTEVEGLTGALVGPNGSPAAGVWVKVYALPPNTSPKVAALAKAADPSDLNGVPAIDSIQTATNGQFTMPNLPNGTYNVAATVRRNDTTYGLFLRNVVVSGLTNLGIDTLKVAGEMVVHVSASGIPVADALCAVPGSPFQSLSDSSGACVLSGLPPGSFQVIITHPSFEGTISGDVNVLSGILIQAGLIQLADKRLFSLKLHHFELTTGTVALWTFDSIQNGKFLDIASGKHDLPAPDGATLTKSPFGSAVSFNGTRSQRLDTALTLAGNRFLTYEVRFRLDAYPPSSQWNGFGSPLGNYSGLKLLVRYDGRIQVVTQSGTDGNWNWYNGLSQAGIVPLKKWVDVAVAADRLNRKLYLYVDGVQQALYYTPPLPSIGTLRGNPDDYFTVGNDGGDPQPFPGLIDEIRVSKSLVHGVGADMVGVPDALAPDLPAVPTIPALLSPDDKAISLFATPTWAFSWSEVPGATRYQLQISSSASFNNFLLNDSTVTGTNRSASLDLSGGVTYYWRVRAKTGGVWRDWSAIRRFANSASTSESYATDTIYVGRDMSTDAEKWNIGLGSDLRLSYVEGAVLLDFPTMPAKVSGVEVVKAELVVLGWGLNADTAKLEVIRHPDADAARWTEGTGHWYTYGGGKYNNYDYVYSLYPEFVPPAGTTSPAAPDTSTWSLAQEVWNMTDTTRIAARWQGKVPSAQNLYPKLSDTKEIRIDVTALTKKTGWNRMLSIRQNPKYTSTVPSTINNFWMYSKDHVSRNYGPRIVLTYRQSTFEPPIDPPEPLP